MIGRALCRSGEIVFDLEVTGGRLTMLPASASYVTVGNGDPRTWIYTVTVDGPGNTRTSSRMRDGVAHLQYAVDPVRPWLGRPPWGAAGLSGALLAGVERQLAGEAGSASGYVMPAPDTGDRGQGDKDDPDAPDPLDKFRNDLAAAKGRTMVAPSMTAGWGGGPGVAPHKDYRPERFGLNPPQAVNELRRDVERSVLAACGVPPVLANHAAPGTSMREAWRQFHTLTVEPLAELIGDQLSEALGTSVALDMRRARAADVVMLVRAATSLVEKGGMNIDAAREVVGL